MKKKMVKVSWYILFLILFTGNLCYSQQKQTIVISHHAYAPARTLFGINKLSTALKAIGYKVSISKDPFQKSELISIGIGAKYKATTNSASPYKSSLSVKPAKEGFRILSTGNNLSIIGNDASGLLYGCLELSDRISVAKALPANLDISDQPEMVLRGTCIGVQKPYYLPGRTVYEYPYTEQTFPWFYDKKLWIQVLDSLLDNRMNSLYLWNGHPFASLVRLKDYPYAVEVDEQTFRKNEEMYRFITTEADKRGIWVIQMFYNIIVSKPFADKHKIKTQDRERPIIPLIADYTRKSIAAFVEKYPNVGLMVCLGEAMEGTGPDDIEWFTKTIIPGVQDGMKALGLKSEPPIVLRAHDTDAPAVMNAALPLYKNLYTEAKFNGEALTYARPRGKWAELHQTLSRLGSVQIENVHILANLEPFRYGSPDFIQQSVIGMHEVMGGNGLHLYPESSYWDWPYSADSVNGKRLLQVERDWIWYKAWSRYAWKSKRDRKDEVNYWTSLLATKYGSDKAGGKNILDAYEASGEIAPKLLRRFGITDGNRQTLTLGMLVTQLINPYRYGLFPLLYDSESPEGEMLIQFAEKEAIGEKHIGETPVQIIAEVKKHGDDAVASIEKAEGTVSKSKPEFQRLRNDMYCYRALAYNYAYKAEAALLVLKYKYSNDIRDLEQALPLLKKSMEWYEELAKLTKSTYLYANSMQTQQRKIPVRGVDGTFKTWVEMLVPFQNELDHFERTLDSLKSTAEIKETVIKPLTGVAVSIKSTVQYYLFDSLSRAFSDTGLVILQMAKELKGLKGIRTSFHEQVRSGTTISFATDKPVKLLVGYFRPQKAAFTRDTIFCKAPELETNASANEYGQSEIRIANGIVIKGLPSVNIHSYQFSAGSHSLKLPKGVCLLVGFVDGSEVIPLYDAGLTEGGMKKEIDWLFE